MNLFELSAKISLDTAEYRAQVEKSKQEMKEAEKGMKDAGAQSEVLKNKLSFLTSQYKTATDTVKRLRTEFNESMRTTGALSNETQALAKQLDTAEKEARDLKNALDQYTSTTTDAATQTKSNADDMGNSWNGFGVTVVGIIVGIFTAAASAAINLSKIGLQFNQEIEGYTTNFKVLLGSTELAAEKVEQLKEMASRTPFGIGDLSQATQTLLGFGIEAKKTEKILTMLGDAALGDKNKLQSLSLSFAQATSAGKLMGQDLMQMINAGFNPLNTIAQQTGLSVGQLKEIMSGTSEEAREVMLKTKGLTDYGRQIIEQNYISAENLYSALEAATSKGGLFYKGMEEASKTTNGLLSTMKDTANELLGKFLYPVSEFLRTNILPGTIGLLDAISAIVEGERGSTGKAAELGTNLIVNIINGIADGAEKVAGPVMAAIGGVLMQIDVSKLAGAGGKLIGRLFNAIATMLRRGGETLALIAPDIISAIPVFLEALFSSVDFAAAATTFFANADILQPMLPALVTAALSTLPEIISVVMDGLSKAAPEIASASFDVARSVITGIANAVIQFAIDIIPTLLNSVINSIFGAGETALGYMSVLFSQVGLSGAAEDLDKARDWLKNNTPALSWESGFTIPTNTKSVESTTTVGDISVNVSVPTTNASPEEIGDAVAEAMAIALGEYTGRKGATHGTKPIMAR